MFAKRLIAASRVAAAVRQSELLEFAATAVRALQKISNRFEIVAQTDESVSVRMQGHNVDASDFAAFGKELKNIGGIVTINKDGTWVIRQD